MANFGPLTADIGPVVWDTPANFNGFLVLVATAASLLTRCQPNFAQCLAVSLPATLYIHFQGLLPRDGILPRVKMHVRSNSCVLLHWQRYCTALQQRASAKLYGVVQGMELRNFRRRRHQGDHHVGHWPTF